MSNRLFPGNKNFLTTCLTEAKERYDCRYLYLNLDPFSGCPRDYCCATRIFKEERKSHCDSPIFFDLSSYRPEVNKTDSWHPLAPPAELEKNV